MRLLGVAMLFGTVATFRRSVKHVEESKDQDVEKKVSNGVGPAKDQVSDRVDAAKKLQSEKVTVRGHWKIFMVINSGRPYEPFIYNFSWGIGVSGGSSKSEAESSLDFSMKNKATQFCIFVCHQNNKTDVEVRAQSTYSQEFGNAAIEVKIGTSAKYYRENGRNLYQFQWVVARGSKTVFVATSRLLVQADNEPKCLPGDEFNDDYSLCKAYPVSALGRRCFETDSCGLDGTRPCRKYLRYTSQCPGGCVSAAAAKRRCDLDRACTAVYGYGQDWWTFDGPCEEARDGYGSSVIFRQPAQAYTHSKSHQGCKELDSCGHLRSDGKPHHCRDFQCSERCRSKCHTATQAEACCDRDETCTAFYGNGKDWWTFHARCRATLHPNPYVVYWKPEPALAYVAEKADAELEFVEKEGDVRET